DTRTARVDEVAHPGGAGRLEDDAHADQVRAGVVEWMFDRVPHPRLGGQVQDVAEARLLEQAADRLGVRDVEPRELEAFGARMPANVGDPVFLERNRVVGVQVVDTVDAVAALEQGDARMHADEAGRSRDENMTGRIIVVGGSHVGCSWTLCWSIGSEGRIFRPSMAALVAVRPSMESVAMKVSVVGTGYVGLVTGACLADSGHEVLCIDTDQIKVDRLREGHIPI